MRRDDEGGWGWSDPAGPIAMALASEQFRIEVPPVRVQRLDQRLLLCAGAGLDLLLAQDRAFHRFVRLEPDEALAAVAPGEAVGGALAMLPGALR